MHRRGFGRVLLTREIDEAERHGFKRIPAVIDDPPMRRRCKSIALVSHGRARTWLQVRWLESVLMRREPRSRLQPARAAKIVASGVPQRRVRNTVRAMVVAKLSMIPEVGCEQASPRWLESALALQPAIMKYPQISSELKKINAA